MQFLLKTIFKQIGVKQIAILLAIVLGIIFLFTSDIFPIKVVSVFIILLSIISLINDILTKFNYSSLNQEKFKVSSATKLKTTIISDEKAKRTIIDNFTENQMDEKFVGFRGDEGFVIINYDYNDMQDNDRIKDSANLSKEFTINFDLQKAPKEVKSETFNNSNDEFVMFDKISKPTDIEEQKDKLEIDSIGDANITKDDSIGDANIAKDDSIEDITNIKDTNEFAYNSNIDVSSSQNISAQYGREELKDVQLNQKEDLIDKPKATILDKIDLSNLFLFEENKNFKGPMEEYAFIVKRFLLIIKNTIKANTVSIIWTNVEKQSLLIDIYFTKYEEYISKEKISFGNDILTRIAKTGKPEIITNIKADAELDFIPYYNRPVGTSSFIGVPIILENSVFGILCADVDLKDAYDKGTVELLGWFTRLISILFISYTKQLKLGSTKKTIEIMNQLSDTISEKGSTFANVCTTILDIIVQLYDFTSSGICLYDEQSKKWYVSNYKSLDNTDEKYFTTPIPIYDSLIGITIKENRNIVLSCLDDKIQKDFVRVNSFETPLPNGAFISIPIKSLTDTYGALFIEAKSSEMLSGIEIELLEALCNRAGEFYEKIALIELYNRSSNIDRQSGILNNRGLKEKISEELIRCNDTKQLLTLTLITLDKYAAFEDVNRKNKVLSYLINECSQYLKPYDAIGKVTNDIIGLVSIGKEAIQLKHIMEELKNKISTNYIEINGEKIFITISVGIVTATEKDNFETFTTNASYALQHAQSRGGNIVQIFN